MKTLKKKVLLLSCRWVLSAQAKAAKVLTPAVAKAGVLDMNLASWLTVGVYI